MNYADVPIELIDVEEQQRRELGDITPLAESLAHIGLLQPINVRAVEDRYVVVTGHRRLAAAREVGWATIPAIVREENHHQRAQFAENTQRLDLTLEETASAVQQLIALGEDPATIKTRNTFMVAEDWQLIHVAPEVVKEGLKSGRLGITELRTLKPLIMEATPEQWAELLPQKDFVTSYDAERLVDRWETVKNMTAVRAKFDALGIPEITSDVKGVATLGKWEDSYERKVNMTTAKHRKYACHAYIIKWDGKAVEVCTTPAVHEALYSGYNVNTGQTSGSNSTGQDLALSSREAARKTRETNKEWRATREAREKAGRKAINEVTYSLMMEALLSEISPGRIQDAFKARNVEINIPVNPRKLVEADDPLDILRFLIIGFSESILGAADAHATSYQLSKAERVFVQEYVRQLTEAKYKWSTIEKKIFGQLGIKLK